MNKYFLIIILLFPVLAFSSENKITIKLDDHVNIELEKEKFEAAGKNIVYWDDSKRAINLIDGWLLFGTDANIPNYKLVSAIVTINDVRFKLDVRGMYEPWWEGNPPQFKLQKFGKIYKLRGHFSAGAGSYEVEWQLIEEKSYRTVIEGKI
ncbi:hypothetical protein [Teredinibacter purpureus]|uniref:hypothetical protein n=1 Tax=Teredinibacter purpureus TaxID=2731756 RepID=UPI0005F79E73|nr:hypothetical protein [Teredinibacter purpureus]